MDLYINGLINYDCFVDIPPSLKTFHDGIKDKRLKILKQSIKCGFCAGVLVNLKTINSCLHRTVRCFCFLALAIKLFLFEKLRVDIEMKPHGVTESNRMCRKLRCNKSSTCRRQ